MLIVALLSGSSRSLSEVRRSISFAFRDLHERRAVERRAHVELHPALVLVVPALPAKQSTRISIARVVGEFMIPNETDANGFVEYRNLCELGGFDVSGPIALADILARVGAGE